MDRDEAPTADEQRAATWLRLLDEPDSLRELAEGPPAEGPPAEVAGLLQTLAPAA